jgi:hypothetical protein
MTTVGYARVSSLGQASRLTEAYRLKLARLEEDRASNARRLKCLWALLP